MNIEKNTLLRVPEVMLIFWIIKILSTTVGETGADFLASDLGLGMPVVTLIMSGIIACLLIFQFTKFKRYIPVNYWAIVLLMSIIGTLITDILVDDFGVSLVTLSIVFTATMLIGFAAWYKSEKTLSIHSIDNTKREAYYWLVILLAFALGTGVGDLISEGMNLGYGIALMLFGGLIALVTFGHYVLKMNAVLSFWLAYILTRPLGASLGDFMIKPGNEGGLGLAISNVNLIFLFTIIGLVAYLDIQHRRTARITQTDM
jgi:uncharacterized membrane-anchored protein